MNTLVIHPYDETTDFLSRIYAGKNWHVINYFCDAYELKFQIMMHDRIIIMGHGIPQGLLGFGGLYINSQFVPVLTDKRKQYVFIWCNADRFVDYYHLQGFYSGMFISEVGEAKFFDIDATQQQIDYSNNLFADIVNKAIDTPNFYDTVKREYIGEDPVIQFNNQRLYYK